MTVRRTTFQVQIMMEINKQMSLCARVRWPPGSMAEWKWGCCSQTWAGSIQSPPASSEAQKASKSCSPCQQKRQRLQMAMWQVPRGEGPGQSWQERLVLRALGSYKWVLDWAWLTGGRHTCSSAVKEPVWMADHHFFTPRNTLYSQ